MVDLLTYLDLDAYVFQCAIYNTFSEERATPLAWGQETKFKSERRQRAFASTTKYRCTQIQFRRASLIFRHYFEMSKFRNFDFRYDDRYGNSASHFARIIVNKHGARRRGAVRCSLVEKISCHICITVLSLKFKDAREVYADMISQKTRLTYRVRSCCITNRINGFSNLRPLRGKMTYIDTSITVDCGSFTDDRLQYGHEEPKLRLPARVV